MRWGEGRGRGEGSQRSRARWSRDTSWCRGGSATVIDLALRWLQPKGQGLKANGFLAPLARSLLSSSSVRACPDPGGSQNHARLNQVPGALPF